MFLKVLIFSTLLCFAVADVKHLFRTYLPPSAQEVSARSNEVSVMAQEVSDLTPNEMGESDLKLDNLDKSTKEVSKDAVYDNVPIGYNGFPGHFPGDYPNQGLTGQIYPRPIIPPQGYFVQGFQRPGFPPTQVLGNQGHTPQYFPGQSFSGQGFAGQGFPGQCFPGQGFTGQGFPGQDFVSPGFSGQDYQNYPAYFSPTHQMEKRKNNYNEDDKLRLGVTNTDTQHDAMKGGYLYKIPAATF